VQTSRSGGPRDNGKRRSTLGSKGQISRSRKANDRFGGLAEAQFFTPLGRVLASFELLQFD